MSDAYQEQGQVTNETNRAFELPGARTPDTDAEPVAAESLQDAMRRMDALRSTREGAEVSRAAELHSRVYSGDATVAKASEYYLRRGDAGLVEFVREKLGKLTPDRPGLSPEFLDRVASAKVLVDKIEASPPVDVPLFRSVSGPHAARFDSVGAGAIIGGGRITSFSSDPEEAAGYHGDYGDPNVLIEVRGLVKALETDPLTGMGHKEYLTTGSYRVVEVSAGKKVQKLAEGYAQKIVEYDRVVTVEPV